MYVLICQNGRFSLRWVGLFAGISIIVIYLMYVFIAKISDLESLFRSAVARITTGQIEGLYHYLKIFPQQVDYLHGRSFPNPGGIFPWEPIRLTVEVKEFVQPNLSSSGIIGSMPTFFWGEMYANFGYLGILIPPLFIGLSFYVIHLCFLALPRTCLVLGVYVWTLWHFQRMTGTGLSKYLLDFTGLAVAIFLFASLAITFRKTNSPVKRYQPLLDKKLNEPK